MVAGFLLNSAGLVKSPLLVAIMFAATGLGIVIPVLKDTDNVESRFGQLTIAGASIAEVLTIVLLSLFFSGTHSSLGAKLSLLVGFLLLIEAVGFAVMEAQHSTRITGI